MSCKVDMARLSSMILTVVEEATTGLTPSVAERVSAYLPAALQVRVVDRDSGSTTVHAAP
jgi:hypothetical protein